MQHKDALQAQSGEFNLAGAMNAAAQKSSTDDGSSSGENGSGDPVPGNLLAGKPIQENPAAYYNYKFFINTTFETGNGETDQVKSTFYVAPDVPGELAEQAARASLVELNANKTFIIKGMSHSFYNWYDTGNEGLDNTTVTVYEGASTENAPRKEMTPEAFRELLPADAGVARVPGEGVQFVGSNGTTYTVPSQEVEIQPAPGERVSLHGINGYDAVNNVGEVSIHVRENGVWKEKFVEEDSIHQTLAHNDVYGEVRENGDVHFIGSDGVERSIAVDYLDTGGADTYRVTDLDVAKVSLRKMNPDGSYDRVEMYENDFEKLLPEDAKATVGDGYSDIVTEIAYLEFVGTDGETYQVADKYAENDGTIAKSNVLTDMVGEKDMKVTAENWNNFLNQFDGNRPEFLEGAKHVNRVARAQPDDTAQNNMQSGENLTPHADRFGEIHEDMVPQILQNSVFADITDGEESTLSETAYYGTAVGIIGAGMVTGVALGSLAGPYTSFLGFWFGTYTAYNANEALGISDGAQEITADIYDSMYRTHQEILKPEMKELARLELERAIREYAEENDINPDTFLDRVADANAPEKIVDTLQDTVILRINNLLRLKDYSNRSLSRDEFDNYPFPVRNIPDTGLTEEEFDNLKANLSKRITILKDELKQYYAGEGGNTPSSDKPDHKQSSTPKEGGPKQDGSTQDHAALTPGLS